MNDQEALEYALYLKGIELTKEQREALNGFTKAVAVFCNDFVETVSAIFQQTITPILDELKEFIKKKPKMKIRYDIVKIIKANPYNGVRRPRLIHCRNNC